MKKLILIFFSISIKDFNNLIIKNEVITNMYIMDPNIILIKAILDPK